MSSLVFWYKWFKHFTILTIALTIEIVTFHSPLYYTDLFLFMSSNTHSNNVCSVFKGHSLRHLCMYVIIVVKNATLYQLVTNAKESHWDK